MCKIKRSSREGVPKVKVADGDVGNLGRVVVEDEIHIPTLQRKREDRRVLLFFCLTLKTNLTCNTWHDWSRLYDPTDENASIAHPVPAKNGI